MTKRAVVLLSGGLDSATALAMARADGFACYALSFAYGQRNRHELHAAARIADQLDVIEHRIFKLDLGQFGGSALTDESIAVPPASASGIPITYVPARNTVFLSLALAWAEVLGASDIFIGVNVVDYSGYPDCRPEFIAAFERMANLATRASTEGKPLTLHTPLMHMSKAEIIRSGTSLGLDYGQTLSCYSPDEQGRACGVCDSCHLRAAGFSTAGVPDPAIYQKNSA
ncbi:MAG: 7-cyano-7-deazaguanine synthase QueC [Thiohalomonadaceae bacterium]